MNTSGAGGEPSGPGWTFLTNHSHVLICITEDDSARSRDIAARVGITERAVYRIVTDLCDAGYVTKIREGRRNRYVAHLDLPLRHQVEGHCTASALLKTVRRQPPAAAVKAVPTINRNRQTMSIPPDAALRLLREGNRRFRADPYIETGALEGHAGLGELSSRQVPFAAVLGCSDSRVPVEVVFGQGPGRLFVVRVAGNVVTPSQLGSLEFAVVQLGVRLIVVLGHSGCGAIEATLAGMVYGDSSEPNGHLGSITGRISRALLNAPRGDDQGGLPEMDEAVRLNVNQSHADLGCESSILAERIGSGDLKVVGAVYELESGRVEFVADAPHETKPMSGVPE